VSLRRCEVPEEGIFGLSISRHSGEKLGGRKKKNNNENFNIRREPDKATLGGWVVANCGTQPRVAKLRFGLSYPLLDLVLCLALYFSFRWSCRRALVVSG
jgi:hypothetical protein